MQGHCSSIGWPIGDLELTLCILKLWLHHYPSISFWSVLLGAQISSARSRPFLPFLDNKSCCLPSMFFAANSSRLLELKEFFVRLTTWTMYSYQQTKLSVLELFLALFWNCCQNMLFQQLFLSNKTAKVVHSACPMSLSQVNAYIFWMLKGDGHSRGFKGIHFLWLYIGTISNFNMSLGISAFFPCKAMVVHCKR